LGNELAAGADARWVPPFAKGITYLHQALMNDSNSIEEWQRNHIIALLLARAAEVNTKDAEGRTPLHVSLIQSPFSWSPDSVRQLLNARGDANEKDNYDLSSIDYARRLCHQILESGGGAHVKCLAKTRAILHELVERPTKAIHLANDRIVGVNFLDKEGTKFLLCTSSCLRVYGLERNQLISKRKVHHSSKQLRVCATAVDACTGVIAVCCDIVDSNSACSMILVWKGLENTDDPLKLFISLPVLSVAGPALSISGHHVSQPVTLSASFKLDTEMQDGRAEDVVLCWVLDPNCQEVLRRYRFAAHAAVVSSDGQWVATVSSQQVEVYDTESCQSVHSGKGFDRRVTPRPGCLCCLCATDATDVASVEDASTVAGVALERTGTANGLLAIAFQVPSSNSAALYSAKAMNCTIVIFGIPHMVSLAVLQNIPAVSEIRFWPLNPDMLLTAHVHGELCLTDYTKERQVAAYNETGTGCLDIARTSGLVATSSEDMLWICELRPFSGNVAQTTLNTQTS